MLGKTGYADILEVVVCGAILRLLFDDDFGMPQPMALPQA